MFGVLLPAFPLPAQVPEPAAQAPTRAGTSIVNRATVTYLDPEINTPITLLSNEVAVIVQPLEALSLTPDNTIQAAPGSPVALPHRLTNTGNTTSTYVLQITNATDDGYDLSNLSLVRDLNGNGRFDEGEPLITSAAPLTLEPGQAADLVVTGTVPSTVPINQVAQVILTATSGLFSAAAATTDTIRTAAEAVLRLNKSASPTSARPGDEVTFTLTATGEGLAPAGIPVEVDGRPQTLVVLRDDLPANITFAGLDDPGSGTPLYHIRGSAPQTYSSTPPADLAAVDAMSYGMAQFPIGGLTLRIRVRLNARAGGDITNVARLLYAAPTSGQLQEILSNPAVMSAPVAAPVIEFSTDASFTRVTSASSVGRTLYVQATALNCSVDPNVAEQQAITITSSLTGDRETFQAVETGPNTGVFRILPPVTTRTGDAQPAEAGNGILETVRRDVLSALLECSGVEVQSPLLIDPYGIVFDSRTGEPIEGTRVTLIDVTGESNGGNAGGPALVFQIDGLTPAPATVVTGPDGQFLFPLVPPGTYRVEVVPPAEGGFPSTVAIGELPEGRIIEPSGSFGGPFTVSAATGAVRFDVPIDTPPPSGLFIEKTTSRRQVEIGDVLDYQVVVRNASDVELPGVMLNDQLPRGFTYIAGTARYGQTVVANPEGGSGPSLRFSLGNLTPDAEVIVSYRVRITGSAEQDIAVNRAQATANTPQGTVSSNVSTARVRVRGGVLTDKGVIIGKVFVDLDGDRVQDEGEPGVPGVRVWVPDGTFAITDEEGKYNLYGLPPRTHVAKLDVATLPSGAHLVPLTNRHGRRGDSVFVDLKKGELHKANFALGSPGEAVLTEIRRRRDKADQFLVDTEGGLLPQLTTEEGVLDYSDLRSRPSSGVIGPNTNIPTFEPLLPGGGPQQLLNEHNSNLPTPPVRVVPRAPLDEVLPQLSNEVDFIDLKDGDTLPGAQQNVRVKGVQDSKFKLLINGEEIGENRVGTRSTLAGKQLAAWEFIGVPLRPGPNTLEVTMFDPFGNARGSRKITVVAPGNLGSVQLLVPGSIFPADGVTPVEIQVQLVDKDNTPVSARTALTLESTGGR